ncbi:carbohydrate ABC transporter permease [Pseudoponticoccus marisrubri]|uniref:ABC transporter permease n=1 Tax=Pseudoponticoccus marisrubri TaxID=1685382 RepID=A0A0W7WGW1_9RHOB|nr:sugar ABC transporter permease [Pseudoponticoccus marisrubri]KUF09872.1 ABC transporter permease [Pseudoponticoccus marisrubri]
MPSAPHAADFRPRPKSRARRISELVPLAVLLPTLITTGIYIFVFVIWNIYLSLTSSTLLPVYDFAGFDAYTRLWRNPRWTTGVWNLALFGLLYIGLTTLVGVVLAILMDQKVRGENLLRSIFLYPIAISFVVTGTTWQWILNPSTGLEAFVKQLGWQGFEMGLITSRETAIYAVVIAAVWHAAGFVMVMVLAALRGVERDLVKAGQIDGAPMLRIYRRIVLPAIWPVLISVLIILLQFAIKTFDLVLALTHGGPGISTTFPAIFVYDRLFAAGELAQGAAAAVWMLIGLVVVFLPVLALNWALKRRKGGAA